MFAMSWGSVEVPPPDVGGMVSAVWGRRVRLGCRVRDARNNAAACLCEAEIP